MKQDIQVFDGAYRPDLSSCIGELEPVSSQQFGQSWPISMGFDQIPLNHQGLHQVPQNAGLVSAGIEPDLNQMVEFERLKVERQISASLYAMNGVNEYLENVFDPSDALWDLPTLSQLFCQS
ncbi:putative DNA binding protein [Corchorus olitorius]|uniref:DNA binding protein n=1 Tax=Corchorus olitorius TaxID=93759 RepID=A0A1R3GI80_9ROSI|nr:putative DNA binding protein [Corchorus olitorius]